MTGTPWRTEPSNPVDDILAIVAEIRRPRTEAELDAEWAARRDLDVRAAWGLFKGGYRGASFADLLKSLSGMSGWSVDYLGADGVSVAFPPRRKAKP